MIRELRRRHRLAWSLLLPTAAILLAAAFLSRPAPPVQGALPNASDYATEAPEPETTGDEEPAPGSAAP